MPAPTICPHCSTANRPDAEACAACGRALGAIREGSQDGLQVMLQRVMGGEVYTAVVGGEGRRSTAGAAAASAGGMTGPAPESMEAAIEDHSDVLAAAVDRIRGKAQEEGQRFKPYVRGKPRPATTPRTKEEFALQLDVGVALLRDRRFEDAVEPLLKAIARDDEDRRPWILLGETYLRIERPYKAAVAYLRALELSPRDEHAWLGLGRVLRSLKELSLAAAVLERSTRIHPEHADSWAEHGLVLADMDDLPVARRSLEKALELRPDHRVARAKQAEVEASMRSRGTMAAVPTPIEAVANPTSTAVARRDSATDILAEMEASLGAEPSAGRRGPLAPDESSGAPGPQRPSERPERVQTYVEGLDENLEGGIPWGHLVLIEGAPGTMKSSLAFSILLHNAAREGLHGLFLSLEERASSLLKQMGSLGLRLEVPKGSLVVLDPRTAADLLGEKADWIDALRDGIRSIKEKRGLDLIVIDSLEALEVLAKFKDRRREMYRLFEWLRDLGVTSFIVTERPDWLIGGHVLQGRWDEDFLADGVIHLRIHMVSDLEAQRRLRVVKMRGAKHETGYLAMVLDDGRFRVTRAMSP
jgi:KaiC/GvpD/RAD55 family RecA-like ATPase/tetratricopeptide (TPR) repeat protein